MKRLLLFLLTASLLLTSMTGCLVNNNPSESTTPNNTTDSTTPAEITTLAETTPEQSTPFATTPSLLEDQTTPPPEETTPPAIDIVTPAPDGAHPFGTEDVSFTATMFAKSIVMSWEYSLEIKTVNGKIYLNDILYDCIGITANSEIRYKEELLLYAGAGDNGTQKLAILEKIKNSESCYILETQDDGKFGSKIAVYYIEDAYYFVNFYEDGDVLRIHSNVKLECPYKWLDFTSLGHYKFALCTCCEYPATIEPHVDNDEDYFCDICGYEGPRSYYLAEKETWLNEISADDIVEIYGTQSGMGTKTYGLKRFITITDKAQIAEILETAKTIHITPFPPNTAGYYPTDISRYIQFTVTDGSIYYIHLMGCEIYAQSPSSSRNGYEGMRIENIPLLDEYENESVFYQLYSINVDDGIVYFDIPNTPTLYDAIGKIALEKMDFTIDLDADIPDVSTDAFIQTKWIGNLEILSATTFSYSGILCTLKDGKTFYDIVDTSGVDQLIAAHEAKYNDGRKATVSTYYGQFASGALVGMIVDDKTAYEEREWADEAHNGRIQYTDSNRIVVLYNGEFYTLREAYKLHIIGDNDMHLIHEIHDSRP